MDAKQGVDNLFSEDIPMLIKDSEPPLWKLCHLSVNKSDSLELILTIPDDDGKDWWFCTTVTEESYGLLKCAQNLTLNFGDLCKKLVQFLCTSKDVGDTTLYLEISYESNTLLDTSQVTFCVCDNREVKNVSLVSFIMEKESPTQAVKRISSSLTKLKVENQELMNKLEESKRKYSELEERFFKTLDVERGQKKEIEWLHKRHSEMLCSKEQEWNYEMQTLTEQFERSSSLRGNELARRQSELQDKNFELSKEVKYRQELEDELSGLRETMSLLCEENLRLQTKISYLKSEAEAAMRDGEGKLLDDQDRNFYALRAKYRESMQTVVKLEEKLYAREHEVVCKVEEIRSLGLDLVKANEIIVQLREELRSQNRAAEHHETSDLEVREELNRFQNVFFNMNRELDEKNKTLGELQMSVTLQRNGIRELEQTVTDQKQEIQVKDNVIYWLSRVAGIPVNNPPQVQLLGPLQPLPALSPPIAALSPPIAASSPPIAASSPPIAASSPPIAASSPPIAASSPPIAASSPPIAASSPPLAAFSPSLAAMNPLVPCYRPPVLMRPGPTVVMETPTFSPFENRLPRSFEPRPSVPHPPGKHFHKK